MDMTLFQRYGWPIFQGLCRRAKEGWFSAIGESTPDAEANSTAVVVISEIAGENLIPFVRAQGFAVNGWAESRLASLPVAPVFPLVQRIECQAPSLRVVPAEPIEIEPSAPEFALTLYVNAPVAWTAEVDFPGSAITAAVSALHGCGVVELSGRTAGIRPGSTGKIVITAEGCAGSPFSIPVRFPRPCSFSDTYPWGTLEFCPSTTASEDCGKQTWDPLGFFNRECTSYVAWKLNEAAGVTDPRASLFNNWMHAEVGAAKGRWSDAANWDDRAQALGAQGFRVDGTPAAGAVAHWDVGEGLGERGHVAFVERVNPDGSAAVSQYNQFGDHFYSTECSVRAPRYIHVLDAIRPPAGSVGASFADNFNRPDSTVVGNGWTGLQSPKSLEIVSGALSMRDAAGGAAGVVRPFSVPGPVTIRADFSEKNGWGGLTCAYDAHLRIRNDGRESSGYGVAFQRADRNYGSSIALMDGSAELSRIDTVLQFGARIRVSATFHTDGRIEGIVSQGGEQEAFSFPARTMTSTGANVAIWTGSPDSRSTAYIFPRIDNVSIEAGAPAPALPPSAPPISAFPAPEDLLGALARFVDDHAAEIPAELASRLGPALVRIEPLIDPNDDAWLKRMAGAVAPRLEAVVHAGSVLASASGLPAGADVVLGIQAGLDIGTAFLNETGAASRREALLLEIVDHITAAAEAMAKPDLAGALVALNLIVYDHLANELEIFGNDPPDPEYRVVAEPDGFVFGPVPSTGDSLLDGALATERESAWDACRFLNAANVSLDRYAGACAAGDHRAALLQITALLEFLQSFDAAATDALRASRAVADRMTELGFGQALFDPEQLRQYQEGIRAQGFPAGLTAVFQRAGVSTAQIEQVRQGILAMDADDVSGSLVSAIGSLPDLLEQVSTASAVRLINISTRGFAATGENTLIAGFVIEGHGTKQVLVRAVGPTLADAPYHVGGVLRNPRLILNRGGVDVAACDDWADGNATVALANAMLGTGAFPIPEGSRDAAVLLDLPAGAYTALVSGVGEATGVALVEVYAVGDERTPGVRVVNLSTRGFVGSGEAIMIPGFVASGDMPRRLLVRAVGPALERFEIGGFLADPILTVHRSGVEAPVASNDDWDADSGGGEIAEAARRVGAFPLPRASTDAALIVEIAPGSIHTVHVSGKSGGTGVALAEIYEIP
jgi:surface antigen